MLHDLITSEPPYVLDPSGAMALGRRRRRAQLALTALGTTAAVAGVVVLLPHGGDAPTSTLQPAASSTPAPAADDRWLPLVRKYTPAEWTVDVAASTDDGWSADVDDGRGAGELAFGLSPHPGSLQQHPCSDPEFVAGGKCEEVDLDADRRLVVSEKADARGWRTVEVVLVHRDGGGVDATAANGTVPRVAPGTVFTSAEDKSRATQPTITRAAPLYDAQTLIELVKAVDAA